MLEERYLLGCDEYPHTPKNAVDNKAQAERDKTMEINQEVRRLLTTAMMMMHRTKTNNQQIL